MKAVMIEIAAADLCAILTGAKRIVNIPAGAAIKFWRECEWYGGHEPENMRLVLRVEHESFDEVTGRGRIPTVAAVYEEPVYDQQPAPRKRPERAKEAVA